MSNPPAHNLDDTSVTCDNCGREYAETNEHAYMASNGGKWRNYCSLTCLTKDGTHEQ